MKTYAYGFPRLGENGELKKVTENFWINPDCGLKIRGWKETRAALRNLVELARKARRWE